MTKAQRRKKIDCPDKKERRVDSCDVKERLDSWVDRERVLCPVSSDRE